MLIGSNRPCRSAPTGHADRLQPAVPDRSQPVQTGANPKPVQTDPNWSESLGLQKLTFNLILPVVTSDERGNSHMANEETKARSPYGNSGLGWNRKVLRERGQWRI